MRRFFVYLVCNLVQFFCVIQLVVFEWMFYVFDGIDYVVVYQFFVLDVDVMVVMVLQQQFNCIGVYVGSQDVVVRNWGIVVLNVVEDGGVSFMVSFFFDVVCQFVNVVYVFGDGYDSVFFFFCDIGFDFCYQIVMGIFYFRYYDEFIVVGNCCCQGQVVIVMVYYFYYGDMLV